MYEDSYGTDWETLTTEEAIERAYALGVAASIDRRLDGEYDRVLDAVGDTYERTLVELAYDEGRTEGMEWEVEGDDEETVWTGLVEGIELPEGVDEAELPEGMPPVLARLAFLEPDGDDLERLRLPRFLFRE